MVVVLHRREEQSVSLALRGEAAQHVHVTGDALAAHLGLAGAGLGQRLEVHLRQYRLHTAQRRTATFAPSTQDLLSSTKERDYFNIDVPEIYNVQGQLVQPGSETAPGTPILQNVLAPDITKKGFLGLGTKTVKNANKYMQQWTPYMGAQGMGYAEGGEVELADGAFVVDARTVSELGNGSSGAGQELLAKMGGRPIRGPGDGVSDSIPARIGRDQPARVARDEVLFTPEAVRKVGKGSEKRGAQKLYALMDKAHDARRKSARGKDTGLRKGLA